MKWRKPLGLGILPFYSYMQLSAHWNPIRLDMKFKRRTAEVPGLGGSAAFCLHAALCSLEPDKARFGSARKNGATLIFRIPPFFATLPLPSSPPQRFCIRQRHALSV
ncbi:hypothetical protein IWT140_00044 [Secundilactobacillus pentosiphilus]|uniref:Uncharacterized protein n=1 Tax=Secundilactobacillus pentosiphilus TaxID=1714682 RepID=A0A1Z5ILC1_9LACO|nr:hypothetical protein IWT140_00044 [Secundilactobacillus pentosiphilus]